MPRLPLTDWRPLKTSSPQMVCPPAPGARGPFSHLGVTTAVSTLLLLSVAAVAVSGRPAPAPIQCETAVGDFHCKMLVTHVCPTAGGPVSGLLLPASGGSGERMLVLVGVASRATVDQSEIQQQGCSGQTKRREQLRMSQAPTAHGEQWKQMTRSEEERVVIVLG